MNTNNPVGDLIALAERLSSLLCEESALLAASRIHEVAALQGDKSKLASAFEAQVVRLERDRKALEDAEAGLRARLGRVMGRVQSTIAENARTLRAARDSTQCLINAIVKAVSESRKDLDVYTERAGMTGSLYGVRPVPKALSLSIDHRL